MDHLKPAVLGATGRPRAAHPSAATLYRFARAEASREEGRQVVSHLLGGCPACGEAIAGEARLTGPKDEDRSCFRTSDAP